MLDCDTFRLNTETMEVKDNRVSVVLVREVTARGIGAGELIVQIRIC